MLLRCKRDKVMIYECGVRLRSEDRIESKS